MLSPTPLQLSNVGHIKSPTLLEISEIGNSVYHSLLNILATTPKSFYVESGQAEYFDGLSLEEQASFNSFELMIENTQVRNLLECALDFFIVEKVLYHDISKAFLVYDGTKDEAGEEIPTGIVASKNFIPIKDIILQKNHIKYEADDMSKVRSKKVLERLEKLRKGRESLKKANSGQINENLQIGNIISSVSNIHPTLNPINIWDLTIYELWDSFYRTCNNQLVNIKNITVAAYGTKDNPYDPEGWYKKLNV